MYRKGVRHVKRYNGLRLEERYRIRFLYPYCDMQHQLRYGAVLSSQYNVANLVPRTCQLPEKDVTVNESESRVEAS